jgi:hypothetical protein
MIPGSESCLKTVTWGFVFCVIFLMYACSDDEPVEKVETETKAKAVQLPEREWYPRQKYSLQQPQISQPQMIQPPVSGSSRPAQQQPLRGGSYQRYPAPQVIIVQPPTQLYGTTTGQAPAQMTAPQQYVSPYYYQAPQRPWGVVPQSSQGTQHSYSTPPAGNQQATPWSAWQTPGGTVYPGWGVPYGGYPGTVMPGSVW